MPASNLVYFFFPLFCHLTFPFLPIIQVLVLASTLQTNCLSSQISFYLGEHVALVE